MKFLYCFLFLYYDSCLEGLLDRYCVQEELLEPLKSELIAEYNEMNKGNLEQQGILANQ